MVHLSFHLQIKQNIKFKNHKRIKQLLIIKILDHVLVIRIFIFVKMLIKKETHALFQLRLIIRKDLLNRRKNL
jgi:hypothetical protein